MSRESIENSLRCHRWLNAARKMDLPTLQSMLASDPELAHYQDPTHRRTALMALAERGGLDGVRLLAGHSDLKARDVQLHSALDLASGAGHLECTRFLLEATPSFSGGLLHKAMERAAIGDRGETLSLLLNHAQQHPSRRRGLKLPVVLEVAAAFGSLVCVQLLLDSKKTHTNKLAPHEALITAAANEQMGVLCLLLPLCDVSATSTSGHRLNALMSSVIMQRKDSFEFLLPLTRLDVSDGNGKTAFLWAATAPDPIYLQALRPGSDPNHVDREGRTALMLAIEGGCVGNALYLLDHCDWTRLNVHHRSALDLAIEHELAPVVNAIQQRMATQEREALTEHLHTNGSAETLASTSASASDSPSNCLLICLLICLPIRCDLEGPVGVGPCPRSLGLCPQTPPSRRKAVPNLRRDVGDFD